MVERDKAKLIANKSNLKSDWQVYCKYHDFVIKLNKRKKKLYMTIELITSKMKTRRKLWVEELKLLHPTSKKKDFSYPNQQI